MRTTDEFNEPTAQILEEELSFTLAELSGACQVQTELLVALVQEGVIEPEGEDSADWRFTGASLRRARVALRLQRDLGVNPSGAALALELMDEIATLRARLAALGRHE